MEFETFVGGGAGLNPDKLIGHLLLVWAISYIPNSPTQYSRPDRPSDVIIVDVVDLDTGAIGRESWWRQARLIRDLKPKIGKKLPILVAMTTDVATQGGKPPYQLIDMMSNPQAVAKANGWFMANPDFVVSEPSPVVVPVTVSTPQPQQQVSQGPPPAWATPLPSQPQQPAWMPAEEYWPAQEPRSAPPVQYPPAPPRPMTQAEQMAQEKETYGY
jgi:hypothetical protein